VSFLEARVWGSDATIAVLSGYRGPIFFRFRFFLPVSKAKLFEPGRKLANFISVGSCRSDSVANEGQLICYLP
jgi:hypothetical protein